MTALHLLSLASFLFVAGFTYRACMKGGDPRAAMAEAWLNVLAGFSINYIANLVFLPLIGAAPGLADTFFLGWLYTAVSVLRQYVIRLWFAARKA